MEGVLFLVQAFHVGMWKSRALQEQSHTAKNSPMEIKSFFGPERNLFKFTNCVGATQWYEPRFSDLMHDFSLARQGETVVRKEVISLHIRARIWNHPDILISRSCVKFVLEEDKRSVKPWSSEREVSDLFNMQSPTTRRPLITMAVCRQLCQYQDQTPHFLINCLINTVKLDLTKDKKTLAKYKKRYSCRQYP